jgi:hypothetical protein
MPWWWGKKKGASPRFSVSPRREGSSASKVDVSSLAPPAADLLAGACAVQLNFASELAAVSQEAWSAEDADALMQASAQAMDRYRALRLILGDYDPDVVGALAAPRQQLSPHLERFSTTRWYERVGTVYVVAGICRDFWHLLAGGLPDPVRRQIQDVLADQGDEEILAGVLSRVLLADQRYVSRLSLWARRLVGDAMLICKDAISRAAAQSSDADLRLEPVFTDIVALHTRRLDRIGLTA